MIDYIPTNNVFNKELKDRFWDKVQSRQAGECWNWIGALDSSGYGNFLVENSTMKAHRVSYMMHYGEITKDLQVCHKCDNPHCVNPLHLFLGSNSENQLDRYKKNSHTPKGYNISKFTKEEITLICTLRRENKTLKSIGDFMGITPSHVLYITKHEETIQCR